MSNHRQTAAALSAQNAPGLESIDSSEGARAYAAPVLRRTARREGSRMARFGGVGVANSITDFSTYWVFVAFGAAPALANVAGFIIANLQSYLLNSRFTFSAHGRIAARSLSGYGKFLIAHLMSLAVSTVMILALAGNIGPLPAKAAAMGFTFLWNYTMSALFVFAERDIRSGEEPGDHA